MLPNDRKYTKTHEWVIITGPVARVGLTDHAQHSLGALVFIELPGIGDPVVAGQSLGDVESVKAVSDVVSPVTGTVRAVNKALADAPERINDDPWNAWLVEIDSIAGTEELLDAAEYEAFCQNEE